MIYNIKITEYHNEIQINRYNYDIQREEDSVKNEISKQHITSNKQFCNAYKQLDQAAAEARALKNLNDSKRRSMQTVYKLCRANFWEYFATFTFSDNRYSYESCKKRIQTFLNNFSKRNTHIEYIVVPEQHKDSAWHFHALIIGDIKPWLIDSPFNAGRYIWKSYKYGINEVEPVRDPNRVSMYITKYIVKSLGDGLGNKRRYFNTQGLSKGSEKFVYFDDDNIFDFIQSNFPEYEFNHIKSALWGIDNKVDYIQLKKKESVRVES